MVQELLAQKFGMDKLRMNVNPDEAVAQGAAILANELINTELVARPEDRLLLCATVEGF